MKSRSKKYMGKTGRRIFLSYIITLIAAMILCGVLVGGFVMGHVRKQTVDYNSKSMSAIVHDLDSLNQRITQFLSMVYEMDIYPVLTLSGNAHDYESMKKQLDLEAHIRSSIQFYGIKNDVAGMLIYLDDERWIYIGDGVIQPDLLISQSDWYKEFEQSTQRSSIIGPLSGNALPGGIGKDMVLYINSLNPPQNVKTHKRPFVMMIARFDSIQKQVDTFFGEQGVLIVNSDQETVYTSNLPENWKETVFALLDQGTLNADENGISVYSGKDILITGVYAEKYGWTLYSLNPTSEVFAGTHTVVAVIVLIFVMCSILGVVAAWYNTKSVMVPIHTMNQMIGQMEKSEDAFIEITGNDEIGQIGARFNAMKLRLQGMSRQIYISGMREQQAQLAALQSQINPHFLYNTLDNIRGIAQINGEDDIVTLTGSLSSMLRYSINAERATATLESELSHIKEYISIINLRHNNAIQYEEQVDISLYELKIIRLLLQPLVENAWMHGISRKKNREGKITLSAEIQNGKLLVTVEDDGVGIDEDTITKLEKSFDDASVPEENTSLEMLANPEQEVSDQCDAGIGLSNVYHRIRLAYGEEYSLKIESQPERGCKIYLWLDIKCS